VYRALEVYYDNVLYKFTFDINIDLLVSWGGGAPIRFPPRRLRRLDLGAFGTSLVRSPTQIPGYAYDVWSLLFAFISGQMALASSFSSHFGPHLPLLFKLHALNLVS